MKTLITAGLVAVKDRRLLLAFSNNKRALTGQSPVVNERHGPRSPTLDLFRQRITFQPILCRNFYLPGGKAEEGETTLAALVREVLEELNVELDPAHLSFYSHIKAPAFGEPAGILMAQDCFRYDLREEPRPAAEIGALRYFDTAAYRKEPIQVPGVVIVMQQLRQDNLID